jgi:hypothetical protein
MPAIATSVRHIASILAVVTPFAAVDAQVHAQVRNLNGATWTSVITVSSLAPLTFRWRWGGSQTPTGVAWQLATVTPISTATTRASDVIADETGLRLPANAGAYEEFTVTPSASWPAKFYIRVRVNLGRTAVYSPWTTVTVVQRTTLVANPTCRIEGWKVDEAHLSGHPWDPSTQAIPEKKQSVQSGELVDGGIWEYVIVRFLFQNRHATAPVSFRRTLKSSLVEDGKDLLWLYGAKDAPVLEPSEIQTLAASKTEIITFYMMAGGLIPRPTGILRFDATTTPLSGTGDKCSFIFTIK